MTTASEQPRTRRYAFIATGLALALLAAAAGLALQQMPTGSTLALDLFGMKVHLTVGSGPHALALTFREAS